MTLKTMIAASSDPSPGHRQCDHSQPRITVSKLRPVLADFFAEADTVLRRLREAGILPVGGSGYAGARSAKLDIRQAALVLIAVALPLPPLATPEAATWVAEFRLRARDTLERREHLDGFSGLRFIDFLVAEIDACRGANPGYCPAGWEIERNEAAQRAPDRLVFTGYPRGYGPVRPGVIPGQAIAAVAALFPDREPEDPTPELLTAVAGALKAAA